MIVSLIAPFILRLAGLQVNEIPKFMAKCSILDHHSILVLNTDVRIPMSLKGIISYIHTRLPTSDEINYRNVNPDQCIDLTPDLSEWNPHNPSYGI